MVESDFVNADTDQGLKVSIYLADKPVQMEIMYFCLVTLDLDKKCWMNNVTLSECFGSGLES